MNSSDFLTQWYCIENNEDKNKMTDYLCQLLADDIKNEKIDYLIIEIVNRMMSDDSRIKAESKLNTLKKY